MNAGQMRDQLQILTPTVIDDGRGGQTVVYPESGPWVAASVRAASNREQAAAGALQTMATHIVEVYANPRVTSDVRLRRVGPARPTLEIVSLKENDYRTKFILECAEVI